MSSGHNVINELQEISNNIKSAGNSNLFCKSVFKDQGTEVSGKNLYFDAKPYPAPNPNRFALLEKPGINRYVMRGCFKTDSANRPIWDKNYTENKTICDDYEGSYCGGSDQRKEKCINDAPGGLADFTHPMVIDKDYSQNKDNDDYIRNGFIIDQCECSLNSNKLDSTFLNFQVLVLKVHQNILAGMINA